MGELTDNQKLLLAIGLSRGERIADNKYKNTLLMAEDAKSLYADPHTAHSALISMVFKGYIDTTDVPGRFIVVRGSDEIEAKANQLREKRKKREQKLATDFMDG